MNEDNKLLKRAFIIISILVPVLVAVLIYLPKGNVSETPAWIFSLPGYNAIINTLTSMLLIAGVYFVKQGKVKQHKISMVSAFVLGIFFLIFYILYHSNAESVRFGGEGWIRYVYFFFLISHILLAFVVVPLVLSAIYFALFQKIERHKKIVRFTFPVWLYVSVTGVIVYLMISPYYIH